MSNTEEQTVEKIQEVTLGSAVVKALIAWLKILIYYVILPFKIWKAATYRLAKNNDSAIVADDEEFPMYTFTKVSLDASIFMTGILSVPFAFIGVGFIMYLVVIPSISFAKEVITMSLISVQKLTQIEKNTTK